MNTPQAERKRRDDLYDEWHKYHRELVDRDFPGSAIPARLRMLRPIRKEGDIFVIEHNEMHVDWLKHRMPKLYEELSKGCRMVKRDAE